MLRREFSFFTTVVIEAISALNPVALKQIVIQIILWSFLTVALNLVALNFYRSASSHPPYPTTRFFAYGDGKI